MTPTKRPIKTVRYSYGPPVGYNYDLGRIAFGETPKQERARISEGLRKENVI